MKNNNKKNKFKSLKLKHKIIIVSLHLILIPLIIHTPRLYNYNSSLKKNNILELNSLYLNKNINKSQENLKYVKTRIDKTNHNQKFYNPIFTTKQDAINKIKSAKTIQEVQRMVFSSTKKTGIVKILATIKKYNLLISKTEAIKIINNIKIPIIDKNNHDEEIYNLILTAKQEAINKIKSAKTIQEVHKMVISSSKGTEIVKILAKIATYNFFKSFKILENAKKRASDIIKSIKFKIQEIESHYVMFETAKQEAINKIKSAKTIQEVQRMVFSSTKGTEIVKILATIKKYNLLISKTEAIKIINNIKIPIIDKNNHDEELYNLILTAKQEAINKIKSAKTIQEVQRMVFSPTKGTEIVKILATIKKYNLLISKTETIKIINNIKIPIIDKNNHDEELYNLILTAKQEAINKIKSAKTIQEVHKMVISSSKGTEIVKILAKIATYNFFKSFKILENAKKRASDIIKSIKFKIQEIESHYVMFETAKQEAINKIKSAKTIQEVQRMVFSSTKGTEIVKILATIKKYNLLISKTEAIKIINNIKIPIIDKNNHDEELYNLILNAKQEAINKIKSAKTIQEVHKMVISSSKGTEIVKILAKIATYNFFKSFQILENAKKRASDIIKSIKFKIQEIESHYVMFETAKQEAINKIKSAKTIQEVQRMVFSSTKGTEIVKILATIKKYNLLISKTEAIKIINNIKIPIIDKNNHDEELYNLILTAKQEAINKIKSAKTIQEVQRMVFSPTKGTEIVKIISKIQAYKNVFQKGEIDIDPKYKKKFNNPIVTKKLSTKKIIAIIIGSLIGFLGIPLLIIKLSKKIKWKWYMKL